MSSARVFVLDRRKRPLMPCHPARARKLLKSGRARVHRLFPFTIRLTDRLSEDSAVQEVLVKVDPGSKETGMALVRKDEKGAQHALFFCCLRHRGAEIRDRLTMRRAFRRRRRQANLRYRAPRFLNRRKGEGWIPPSLRHRADTALSWVRRFMRLAPVSGLVQELVKFDAQLMQNPGISGIEYQQGELAGYEVKEYLLQKFGRQCVYCGKKGVPLNIEHIVPKARGGSDRVSNLAIACAACNQKKGARPIEEFLKRSPEVLARVRRQLRKPLADAAAANVVCRALHEALRGTGLPVEAASGALTKFNRHVFGVPKEHWLDALCAGRVNGVADWEGLGVLFIRCAGRGAYQRTRLNRFGLPRGYLMREKKVRGFATGDMAEAVVPAGKKKGSWRGRVAVRKSGRFDIRTESGVVAGLGWKCFRRLAPNDGYGYEWQSRPAHACPS